MIGIGEIYSLSCAVVWALAVIMYKRLGDKLPPFELNLIKNLIASTLLLITALVVEGWQMPELSWQEWAVVIVSGYIGIAIADTWYFQALNHIGASRTGIVASLYSPYVILLSAILLGEMLTAWQFVGFFLVLGGIWVVNFRQKIIDLPAGHLKKGLLFGAASVFLTALGVVMVKPILEGDGFFWVIFFRILAGLVGMVAVAALQKKLRGAVALLRSPLPWANILTASFLGTYLAMVLWLAGYKYTSASISSVLNETSTSFIVIFAWLFLGEEINARKWIGLLLTLAGVLLIILS